MDRLPAWPDLTLDRWADTRDTVHMWTQVVGKVQLALNPMINHWWQVSLRLSGRGLTTGLMPAGDRGLEIEFDVIDHQLQLRTTDGSHRSVALAPKSVATFHRETLAALEGLGVAVEIRTQPSEVAVGIPFDRDEAHHAYDPAAVERFWRALVQMHQVLRVFRGMFVGKHSPVHFFWGGFDLASTRFSGRPAPRHPGGVPNCPDYVQELAYSHELSSCGYWPGGAAEGAFYSYAYPTPDGFADWPVEPAPARYDAELGEFLLPYEAVRTADDPDALLLAFLQSTYEAAATLAGWDRAALEAPSQPVR